MPIDIHGISEGINAQSLENPIALVVEEIAAEEQRMLLKALPGSVTPAVEEILADVKQKLLLLVARQNDICEAAAEQACDELRSDKRNANWRISELEKEVEDQAETICTLQEQRDGLQADITKAHKELVAVRDELRRQRQNASTVDRLFLELRDPEVRDSIRNVLAGITATRPASTDTEGQ